MSTWDDEYGEVPNNTEDITKNAKRIDTKLLEGKRTIKADIGICSTCIFCSIYERELGDIFFKCNSHDKTLSLNRPKIIKCTDYKKRNSMSLQEMIGMAWTINPDKKTIKGFGQNG
jgi:hypothetical protein